MDKNKYIEIWMNPSLSDDEKRNLLPDEVYKRFLEIDDSLKALKAPNWDVESRLEEFRARSEGHRTAKVVNMRPIYAFAVAAAIVLLAVFYFILRSPVTEVRSLTGESISYFLPDSSEVILNAGSVITFDENKWDGQRTITLEGEAYFVVRKGSVFSVTGDTWTVSVLGTKFNVVSRNDIFDVRCFEGKVKVSYDDEEKILVQGQGITGRGNKTESLSFSTDSYQPSWMGGVSEFSSKPLSYVLDEIERQFGISINTDGLNEEILFTGSFDHTDLSSALNTVSLSTGCDVKIQDKIVTFTCGK